MSNSPTGPWTSKGILNGRVSSETNHQSIIEFKGQWYFIYHNAGAPGGGNYRRSVCIDYLYYNTDGTMKRIVQTTSGVKQVVTGLEDDTEGEDKPFTFENLDPETIMEYEIYDLQGKAISKGIGTKQNMMSEMKEGSSYVMRIKDGDDFQSFKILKY